MTGESIICFAKDWSEDPTSNNHVMREISRGNKVLWLNSIATRTPSLASGRDVKKILRKLAGFFKGADKVTDNLWVYTPVVLPFPHSSVARKINQRILRMTLTSLRRKMGMKDFQLWTFLPNVAEYVGKLGESMVVYYCVDDWAGFSYVDGEKIAAAERALCEKADVVFGVTQRLVDKRLPWNLETHLAPHGVDHALFASAMDGRLKVPDDIAALPKPVIGFYGTLQDWVDQDLIVYLAKRHPEWAIALIGNPLTDTTKLAGQENIHIMGRRKHPELPAYCKGFDVGIIPYVVNERMLTVNPIKLREYLSAGLPVVSTSFPEVCRYSKYICVADNYEEFERGIVNALETDTPGARAMRSDAMRGETWEARVADIGKAVMRVKESKCRK